MSQIAKRTSVASTMLLLLHPAKQKNYEIHEEIGRGAYGKVVLATWHEPRTESEDQTSKEELPSKTVALKIVKKRKFLHPNREASSAVELKHLQNLDHPNIVKVYEVFESFSCYYIALEHLDGGELFARIHERSGDQFREADAVRIVKSVLKGIEYLHRKNIVHHDIKASNILFRTKARDSDVVIVDFGISRQLSSPYERLHGLRGTLPYLAPEVLMRKGHGRGIDMWALGNVTYKLLTGLLPFDDDGFPSLRAYIRHVRRGKLRLNSAAWADISEDAKYFVKGLLHCDADERPNVLAALAHPWITEPRPANGPLLRGLRDHFDARRRWRAAINGALAARRLKAHGRARAAREGPGRRASAPPLPLHADSHAGRALLDDLCRRFDSALAHENDWRYCFDDTDSDHRWSWLDDLAL